MCLAPPPAGEFETIPADLVLKSIGFKSVGIPGVAFDGRRGVIPNQAGQVRRQAEPGRAGRAAGRQAGTAGLGWANRWLRGGCGGAERGGA